MNLVCKGPLLPYKANTKLTSLCHCTNQRNFFFFLKLTKYVLHLNFSVNFAPPYMVFTSFVLLKWSLIVLVLNRLLPLLFHTFKSLLGWNVFVILLNRQSLPFLYIHGKYQTPVFTFRHFWFKDPLMLEFIFLWYLY